MGKSEQLCVKTLMEQLNNVEHNISNEDYCKLKENYRLIMTILWINEKYTMILDNYYEFVLEIKETQAKLLKIQENEMVNVGKKSIIAFNRRLSNLLCSVRMYIDQTQHELSKLGIKECTKDDFHTYTSEMYDSSVGYQIMELLRNHIQHQGLIVDRITLIRPFFDNNEEYIFLIIDIAYKRLCNIEQYEKKIFLDNILRDMNVDTFNLLWFVDEYVKGLEIVHKKLMEKLFKKIVDAQNQIESILKRNYNQIPSEIGVFGYGDDFLLQYNYVLQALNIPRIVDCYEGKKFFRSSERVKGNYQKNTIRYNM